MRIFFVVALLLSGCATKIRDPKTGVTVFQTYADSKQIAFTKNGDDYRLEAIDLNHSLPTRALGSLIGTAGTAISVSGLGAIFRR